jgi:tetratricopeptide (TPR) repeat protein
MSKHGIFQTSRTGRTGRTVWAGWGLGARFNAKAQGRRGKQGLKGTEGRRGRCGCRGCCGLPALEKPVPFAPEFAKNMKRILCLTLALLLGYLPAFDSMGAAAKRQPTANECKDLGMSIAAAISAEDLNTFIGAFDFDAMISRALEGLPDAESMPANMRKGLRDGFAKSLRETASQVERATFIRFEGKTGETQILLRVEFDEESFNYWFFTVAYAGSSNPKIVDFLPMGKGENASVSLRRLFLPILADANKSFLAKLTGEQSEFMKHKDDYMAFYKLANEKKHAAALAMYARLPASMQQDRSSQVIRLTAASHVSAEKFTEAVQQYGKLFPNDSSLAYYKYHAHQEKEEYSEMLKDIDEMDKAFGPDTFFFLLRAKVLAEMNKPDEAIAMVQKALSNRRTLEAEGSLYLVLLAQASRFDDLGRFLRELERDNDDLEMYSIIHDNEEFKGFFKSEAFRKWMESPLKRKVDPAIRPKSGAVAAKPAAPGSAPKATPTAAPVPEAPKAPEPPYKLGGILYSPKSPAAIINGKTVYVGDKIKEAKVIKIEQSTVTLEINGKMEEFKLK